MSQIGIVIPTYNRKDFIREALDSVFSQKIEPMPQVIIVDDGSQDGTRELYENISINVSAKPAGEFQYFWKKNTGVADTRNEGVRQLATEYVAFLDSDDVWLDGISQIQKAVLDANSDVDWVFTNFIQTDLQLKTLAGVNGFKRGFPVFAHTSLEPEGFFTENLQKNEIEVLGRQHVFYSGDFFPLLFRGNMVQPSGVMVRRKSFEDAGGFDPKLRFAEDTEFFHRFSAKHRGAVVMTPLYLWRMGHTTSLASSMNTLVLIEQGIASVDQAAKLRVLDAKSEKFYMAGTKLLYETLAYAQLARGMNGKSRKTIMKMWKDRRIFTLKSAVFLFAGFIPAALIQRLRTLLSSA